MPIVSRLALALILALLGGCAGTERAPDSAFATLPPQTYPFDTVWECLIEAAENLTFTIVDASRDGEQGEFATEILVTFSDTLKDAEQGQGLHATIVSVEDKHQTVSLAASRFERRGGGSWSYVRSDDELRARFETAFRAAIRKRYRDEASEGQTDGY